MKKIFVLILALLMVLMMFCSCGKKNGSAGANKNNGNKIDPSPYAGIWAEDGIGWEKGGLILDIVINKKTIDFEFVNTHSAPDCMVATASLSAIVDNFVGNKLTLSFLDDWGNEGKISLEFLNDKISCKIFDVEFTEGDYAEWGLQNGQYTLIRNDNAHDVMQIPSDGLVEMDPTEQVSTEGTEAITLEEPK